jgi:hypothetical protein
MYIVIGMDLIINLGIRKKIDTQIHTPKIKQNFCILNYLIQNLQNTQTVIPEKLKTQTQI